MRPIVLYPLRGASIWKQFLTTKGWVPSGESQSSLSHPMKTFQTSMLGHTEVTGIGCTCMKILSRSARRGFSNFPLIMSIPVHYVVKMSSFFHTSSDVKRVCAKLRRKVDFFGWGRGVSIVVQTIPQVCPLQTLLNQIQLTPKDTPSCRCREGWEPEVDLLNSIYVKC